MADYRICYLDEVGGIVGAEWIQADSDDEAVALTRTKKLRLRCELWEGTRLVAHLGVEPGSGTTRL